MLRYVVLAGLMIAFQDFAGEQGSAYLLSSIIGLWACGVAMYEVRVGNFPLPFPKRKINPAASPPSVT